MYSTHSVSLSPKHTLSHTPIPFIYSLFNFITSILLTLSPLPSPFHLMIMPSYQNNITFPKYLISDLWEVQGHLLYHIKTPTTRFNNSQQ